MLKLFYAPGVCSSGIHILLEEIGKPYEAEALSLKDKLHHQNKEFMAVTHKGSVPALRLADGTGLTEYPAIALYLAKKYPEAGLLPATLEKQAKALAVTCYISETVHAGGFRRIFRPEFFSKNPADHEFLKAEGQKFLSLSFHYLNGLLAGKEWLFDTYSFADSALFYVCLWTFRINLPLPPECLRHFKQMLQRPAVQHVMKKEGLEIPAC